MSEGRKFWGQKTLCLVTGASQGIGKCLAVEFSKKFSPGSRIVLMARSEKNLEGTAQEIMLNTQGITTVIQVCDLSKPDYKLMDEMVQNCIREEFDLHILVHNAGSEGSVELALDMNNLIEWESYMALNLHSVALLTSAFVKSIGEKQISLVNITSLAAIQPFKSMAFYCVGKAAREMYFRVLAEENPRLDILSYSPGPVKTDIIDRVIEKCRDEEVKAGFSSLKREGRLLSCEGTVARLVALLAAGSYTSGARVDYFDSQE